MVTMRRRAHHQTYVIVVIIQLLAMAMPVVWWIGHKRPPAWNVWLGWFVAWPLVLIGPFLIGALWMTVSDKINDLKRKRSGPKS
jgi:hypothetical protein